MWLHSTPRVSSACTRSMAARPKNLGRSDFAPRSGGADATSRRRTIRELPEHGIMRSLALVLVLLGLGAPASAQEALLVGSSSVNGALGRTLEHRLGIEGIRLARRARSASGFARPEFFDWEAEVDQLGALSRYAAVIVYAGGNDGQALSLRPSERTRRRDRWVEWSDEERWVRIYSDRVRGVVDAMCDRGAPRVVILLVADGGRAGWSRRMVRVRDAQRAGVEGSRCGVVLDPNDGHAFDSVDGVHLSRQGARRMWELIAVRLRALLLRRGS